MLKIVFSTSEIVDEARARQAMRVYTKRHADALPGIATASAHTPDTCAACGGPCWSTDANAYTTRCSKCTRKLGF
jgi:hypothetical protein